MSDFKPNTAYWHLNRSEADRLRRDLSSALSSNIILQQDRDAIEQILQRAALREVMRLVPEKNLDKAIREIWKRLGDDKGKEESNGTI